MEAINEKEGLNQCRFCHKSYAHKSSRESRSSHFGVMIQILDLGEFESFHFLEKL